MQHDDIGFIPDDVGFVEDKGSELKDDLNPLIRQTGRLGRAAATGIAGLADLPNLAALGLHAAGLKKDATFYEPIAGRVQGKIDELTGGKLKARNKAEEYMDVGAESLAPLLLSPFTGSASLTGIAAKEVAKKAAQHAIKKKALSIAKLKPYALTKENAAASLGSSLGMKHYMETAQDPNLAFMLGAGVVGSAGARAALNPLRSASKVTGKLTRFDPEKYKTLTEADIPVSLGNVSKGHVPSYIEMIAGKVPGSMGVLEKFGKRQEASIARNLGIAGDVEHAVGNPAHHLAKEGAKGYHNRISNAFQKRGEHFKPVEQHLIDKRITTNIDDLIKDLQKERDLSLTQAAQHRFDKSPNGKLLKELKESNPLASHEDIKSLKKQNYPEHILKHIESKHEHRIGLHDLDKLREKALNESIALQTPLGAKTPESIAASKRHEALSKKRHQFLEEHGTEHQQHHAKQARKLWATYKNEKNGMAQYVASIESAKDDVDAFNKLKRHGNAFKVAREGLPKKDRAQLAESFMSTLGDRQGHFSVATAQTAYSKLKPEVKEEFLRSLPNREARNNFKKTMKFVGENKKVVERLANPSGTAHTTEMTSLLKKYGAASAAVAGGLNFMPALSLAGTYGGLKAGAKLWTNQDFLKHVNKAMTSKRSDTIGQGILRALSRSKPPHQEEKE